MSAPTIWLVGDWQESVFAAAVEWLESRVAVVGFDSPQLAIARHAANDHVAPTVILLASSRPGRFSATSVEELHACEPLARLIALTGPWCEGEMRSGQPWPGVVRVPWSAWRARLPCELGLIGTAAAMPRTATDTERWEMTSSVVCDREQRPASVEIRTRSLANYRYLADAVRQLGHQPMPRLSEALQPTDSADVVIFDGWENVSQRATGERPDGQRRILALHFPRPDDHLRAPSFYIDAILAQPLSFPDLSAALASPIIGVNNITTALH